MRFRSIMLLSVVVLALAAGCTAAPSPTLAAHVVQPDAASDDAGPAVAAPADAIATGKRLLEMGGFTWVGSPQVALAQRMTYAEAAQRIPAMSDPQNSPLWPDKPVWLVIFRGQWDLMPMGPVGATLVPNRYQGCLMILFSATDGQFVAAGDTLCP